MQRSGGRDLGRRRGPERREWRSRKRGRRRPREKGGRDIQKETGTETQKRWGREPETRERGIYSTRERVEQGGVQKNEQDNGQGSIRENGAVGAHGRKLDRWVDPHAGVSPVHLSVCAQVGISILLGSSHSSPPGTPARLTGAASREHDPLASETPPGGTPWWRLPPRVTPPVPPRRSPRPRARAAASGFPGSAPARPAPQLRSGGRRLRVQAAPGAVTGLSAGGGAREAPPQPHQAPPLVCQTRPLSQPFHPRPVSSWPSKTTPLGSELTPPSSRPPILFLPQATPPSPFHPPGSYPDFLSSPEFSSPSFLSPTSVPPNFVPYNPVFSDFPSAFTLQFLHPWTPSPPPPPNSIPIPPRPQFQ